MNNNSLVIIKNAKRLLLCQLYSPAAADSDEEIENFNEKVENAINETKKWIDRRERFIELCISNKLIVCNTWFKHRENSKHSWSALDGRRKNQIDYIMITKRYGNSIKMLMPG